MKNADDGGGKRYCQKSCLKFVDCAKRIKLQSDLTFCILYLYILYKIIGNIIKENASISGAFAGCQSEIGSACSMSAGAVSYLNKQDIDVVEYAAEIALEHHLGLTCDPINGLVQIPCIERNAVASIRAIDAASLAKFLNKTRNGEKSILLRCKE